MEIRWPGLPTNFQRQYTGATDLPLMTCSKENGLADESSANPYFFEIAEAGLEPARPNGHRILNPERLPIPPLGQVHGRLDGC